MINFWIAAIARMRNLFRKMFQKTSARDKLIQEIIKQSRKVHQMMILLERQERKVIKAKQEVAQLIHEYRKTI